MNRESQLLKNTLILALGNISTKCMTFLLVPLYTSYLSTSEYGVIDLLNTFTTLLVPVISLQLTSAVFRFLIEANTEEKKSEVITNIYTLLLVCSLVFFGICLIVGRFVEIPYLILLALGVLANIFAETELQYARGEGDFLVYSVTSVIIALVTIISNFVMILGFHMGGESILVATNVSYFAGGIFVMIFTKNYRFIRIKSIKANVIKQYLLYSIPLIPNQLSWWITNVSNRLIVALFLNTSANGILAVAHKLPGLYTIAFNIFNVTWAESICRAIEDRDIKEYTQKIYKSAFQLLSGIALLVIACIPVIFDWYVGKNYSSTYIHILILCIAMFINSIGSLYGGIFIAAKKSKEIGTSTIIGAVLNVLFHLGLINYIGLYAATYSTLISYVVILIVRKRTADQIIKLGYDKKYLINFLILTMLTIYAYIRKIFWLSIVILAIDFIWFCIINKNYILKTLRKFVRRNK